MYPRAESNRNRRNRNPKFYPLNYGGIRTANIHNFSEYGVAGILFFRDRGNILVLWRQTFFCPLETLVIFIIFAGPQKMNINCRNA